MDITNRVLAVGVSLLWIFIVLVIILLAWGAPDQSIERVADLAGYMEDHNTTGAKLIVTFGGLIFVLLGVIVIILEVTPPETGSVRVAKVGSGQARIGTNEVSLRLEEELRAMPQVSQVQATVLARGQKAEVRLDLHVASDADLTATSEEACRRARTLIEERMGVQLSSVPQAQIHYRELRVARPQEISPSTSSTMTSAAPPSHEPPPAAPAGPGATEPAASASPPSTGEPTHEAAETSPEDRPAGA